MKEEESVRNTAQKMYITKLNTDKEEKRQINIQADHIKPFAIYPDLRFDINNGRTLCEDCHRKTPTW